MQGHCRTLSIHKYKTKKQQEKKKQQRKKEVNMWTLCPVAAFLMLQLLEFRPTASKVKIPIGTIFSKAPDWQDVFDAMNLAMEGHHAANNASTDFDMKFYVDNIDTVDAYKLTKIICRQV